MPASVVRSLRLALFTLVLLGAVLGGCTRDGSSNSERGQPTPGTEAPLPSPGEDVVVPPPSDDDFDSPSESDGGVAPPGSSDGDTPDSEDPSDPGDGVTEGPSPSDGDREPSETDAGVSPPNPGDPDEPGTNPSGPALVGKAIDGYLANAEVFLDLNGNARRDDGEPHTTTDAEGTFVLSATQSQIESYPVYVKAIAGQTIDLDRPGVPIEHSYTLVSQPGSTVVSPLTTAFHFVLVHGNLGEEGAEDHLRDTLQLSETDFADDYVSNSDTAAHQMASAIVPMLQGIEALQASAPTMTTTEAGKLTARYVETLVGEKAAQILEAEDRDAAISEIAGRVFVNSAAFACESGHELSFANADDDSDGAYVFMIDPLGQGGNTRWGQYFRAPIDGVMTEVSVFVRNFGATDPPATRLWVELQEWPGETLFRSEEVLFINPNLNAPSRAGTRPFAWTGLSVPVVAGLSYVLAIVGDGGVAIDAVDSPTAVESPSESGIVTGGGGNSWSRFTQKNYRTHFCFIPTP
jgi:hypothetical protein